MTEDLRLEEEHIITDYPEDVDGLKDKHIAEDLEIPKDLEDKLEEYDKDSDEYFKKICTEAFKNYRFIVKEEVFFDTVTGQKYSPKQFNTVVSGSFPLYRKPRSIEWGKASRAFLEGKFYLGIKGIRSEINSTKPSGEITNDIDGDIVNTYVKRGEPSSTGNVDKFLELLDVLFEHETDKELMLKIMKWVVEHAGDPKRRLMFAPFITGIEGNGKSTIVNILSHIIGERYTIAPDASTMKGQFSGFLENALLVNINESEEAKNNSLAERIKPWITDKFISIHPKGKDPFKVLNTSTFIITTNNPNALMQTSGSTRFCNFKTRFDSQEELYNYFGSRSKKDSFYEELYDWLEKKRGYSKIHNYLKKSVKYNGFKGNKGRAPYTKSHDAILALQKTDNMKALEECIEELGGVFTIKDLAQHMRNNGYKNPQPTERDILLNKLNYYRSETGKYFNQVRIQISETNVINRRLAFPDNLSGSEAAKLYIKSRKERGESF